MAKLKKPPAEGAPLYMGQFASLMTIMLAFFIALLTLGKDKASTFRVALGDVQTAFGFDAGVGVLQFVKLLMPARPPVEEDLESEDKQFLGYTKGSFSQQSFDLDNIDKTELQYARQVVRVATPVRFAPGEATIEFDGFVFLDRFAAVLGGLPDKIVTIASYTGNDDVDQVLAARRAAAIARYLEERGGIKRERLLPVGYSDVLYLGNMRPDEVAQATVFFISEKSVRREL